MPRDISSKLEEIVLDGWNISNHPQYIDWSRRAISFLTQAVGEDSAKSFETLERHASDWSTGRTAQIGMLEGIVARRNEADQQTVSIGPSAVRVPITVPVSKRVFVVHGHDHGSKESVARFLERLGLEVVILHEKANEGLTVIEKIETHSDVGFAVILLTPDDVGAAKNDAQKLQSRARQNVILELGYFLGKLKRNRVCALYVPGVEIPSDYGGVLFVELDSKGAWRTQLAQELSNARLPINVAGLLNS